MPLQPTLPPHSDPILVQFIAQLQQHCDTQAQQLDTQAKQIQADAKELDYSRLKIQLLEERLRLARIAKYGKASEKLSDLQLDLLELEPGVSSEEVQAESEREPISAPPAAPEDKTPEKPRRKQQDRKHPGRQTLPAHLPRVEKIVSCTPDQCICGGCGKETTVIGYEESEVLDVKPAEYFVTVVKREKRACRSCEQQGVAVAPAPERIIAKSLVSDQVIVDTVVQKYSDSMPLYRQSAMLKRDTGLDIGRSTMDG
jgi:transposase